MGEYVCVSLLHTVSHPSLSTLTLMKWRDCEGRTRNFKLLDLISSEWHTIGILLGVSLSQLANYKQMTNDNITRCHYIFTYWIENDGYLPDYPATWDGLSHLLYDIEHAETAIKLQEVLENTV